MRMFVPPLCLTQSRTEGLSSFTVSIDEWISAFHADILWLDKMAHGVRFYSADRELGNSRNLPIAKSSFL